MLLPLFLASCGSNVGKEADLPSQGTVVDNETGKAKLKAAVKSEITPDDKGSDAFGFSIHDAHFSETIDGSMKMGAMTIASIKSNVEAKNGKISFGIEGLTGDKADNLRASLSMGIDIKGEFKAEYTNPAQPQAEKIEDTTSPLMSYTFDGNYAASADLYQNALYIDYSNKQVFSLISSILGEAANTLPSSGKAKIALGLKDDSFPLVDASDIEDFDKDYEEFFASLPEGGEFKDHGKYGFSYSGTFGEKELEGETENDATTNVPSVNLDFNAGCSLSYALVFKETGLVSFGIEADLGASFSSNAGTSLDSYSLSGTTSVKFGIKFDFLRGSDVKFPTVKTAEFEEVKNS